MKTSRKKFIQSGSIGFFGLISSPLFAHLNLRTEEGDKAVVVVQPGEGEKYWIGERNSPLTIMVAKDRQGINTMSFCSEEIAPGESIPVHKHLNEDELIFIHAGEGILYAGNEEIKVKQGSVALVPKNQWHGIKNTGSENITMVFSYSPAGFEGYFRDLGSPAGIPWKPKSQEEFERIDKKWGIVYKQ